MKRSGSTIGALGQALVAAAVMQWINLRPAAARNSSDRAVQLLDPRRHGAAGVGADLPGALLITDGPRAGGVGGVDAGIGIAERLGAADLVALGQLSRGHARLVLGDRTGSPTCGGMALARALPTHEHVMMGYVNLVVGALWRLGRFAELDGPTSRRGAAYGGDRDFSTSRWAREAYRNRLLMSARRVGGAEAAG